MKPLDIFQGLDNYLEDKSVEELTEANLYIPEEDEYVDFGEDVEEVEVASLWENIRKKKEREGKNYRPAQPGDKDRPSQDALKRAQGAFQYKDPVTGELFYFERRGNYKKNGRMLSFVSKAELEEPTPIYEEKDPKKKDTSFVGKHQVTAPPTMTWQGATAAEKSKKKVKLGKPFRTPSGPKKFSVYVKNEKGNVVKVNFGDPNMEIKRDDPDRRRNFRARHNCDNPGPRWKARYWSCRFWSSPKVSNLTKGKDMSYCNCGKPNRVGGFSCDQHCEHGQAEEISKDVFDNPGEAMKRAEELGLDKIHTHKNKEGKNIFMPGKDHAEYMKAVKSKAGDESSMAKSQLKKIAMQAMKLYEMMEDGAELDGWVQDKLSKSEHNIEAVHDYMVYSDKADAETTEALQYGKPKKNDPRKTPAKPSERKKGSKKNKPDSAKDDKGNITFSKSTMEKLSKAMSEHNAKDKGSKATMGMLKAVYRRGAGAFSTSHAPNMSRDGWGMARVRAFLYLLRNGRPSNPNYKQDNDLLPKGHPRSSK
jgi:hypothetical protein